MAILWRMISYLKSAGCMASFSSHISFTVHMVIETKTTCCCKAGPKLLQVLDWLSWAFSRQTVAPYLLQRFYWPFVQILFYFFLCFILHTVVCLCWADEDFHLSFFEHLHQVLWWSYQVPLVPACAALCCPVSCLTHISFFSVSFSGGGIFLFYFVLLCCCFCGLMFYLIIQLSLLI